MKIETYGIEITTENLHDMGIYITKEEFDEGWFQEHPSSACLGCKWFTGGCIVPTRVCYKRFIGLAFKKGLIKNES